MSVFLGCSAVSEALLFNTRKMWEMHICCFIYRIHCGAVALIWKHGLPPPNVRVPLELGCVCSMFKDVWGCFLSLRTACVLLFDSVFQDRTHVGSHTVMSWFIANHYLASWLLLYFAPPPTCLQKKVKSDTQATGCHKTPHNQSEPQGSMMMDDADSAQTCFSGVQQSWYLKTPRTPLTSDDVSCIYIKHGSYNKKYNKR